MATKERRTLEASLIHFLSFNFVLICSNIELMNCLELYVNVLAPGTYKGAPKSAI